jgi:hypothetical protein
MRDHEKQRRHLRVSILAAVSAVVAVGGVAVAGEAKTPLGKWMKPNLGAPLAGGDLATVKESLTLVAKRPPPKGDYAQWAAIATGGATSAGSGDAAGTKASCKKCHDLYKDKYIAECQDLPFP